MKRKKLLLTLAIPVLMMQNVQAQSPVERTSSSTTMSRLIGIANYSNNGAIFLNSDSSALFYSNQRGGDLKHQLKFDNEVTWTKNLTNDSFYNSYQYFQSFNGDNTLNQNIVEQWNSGVGLWINQNASNYWYDINGNVSTFIYQNWGGASWSSVSKDMYSYSSTNLLLQDMSFSYNLGIWDTAGEVTYYYDSHNNKSQETHATYAAGWVNSMQIVYTYDTANRLLSVTKSNWNGGSWTPFNMYTYAYDMSGNQISKLYQVWNTANNTWLNTNLALYSSFVSYNPQTEQDQNWDSTGSGSWNNVMLYAYTYNGYFQMTSKTGESYNSGLGWEFANGDPKTYYYYGTYELSAVKNVTNSFEANVFPVPAQNVVRLELQSVEPQAYTIALMDISGRILNQYSVASSTKYAGSFSVNNLPNGNYVVKINSEKGQIVKQIVVAH